MCEMKKKLSHKMLCTSRLGCFEQIYDLKKKEKNIKHAR